MDLLELLREEDKDPAFRHMMRFAMKVREDIEALQKKEVQLEQIKNLIK